MIGALIVNLAILAALVFFGYVIIRIFLGGSGPLKTASLAFPLGGGIITWILFLLSWVGMQLTLSTVFIAYSAALILALLLLRLINRRAPNMRDVGNFDGDRSSKWPARVLWSLLLAFLVLGFVLAVGRSHSPWDAAAGWIVKGYGIALKGDIRAAGRWGAWGLSYPLNIPILVSLHRLATADILPGSMLIFPVFAISAAAGIYRFWRQSGVNAWARLLGVGLFIANPLVLFHSTTGYANLPVTVYVVLGTCWMIEGLDSSRKEGIALGSMLFGLASWTRSDAVAYGLFAIPVLIAVFWVARKSPPAIAYAVVPFAIVAGSWFTFSWSSVERSSLGSAVRGVLPRLQEGEYQLGELFLIPRLLAKRAFIPDIWGLLFPVSGLLILLGVGKLLKFPKNPRYLASFAATIAICLIPIGFFYVRSFTFSSFVALLHRSFDRAFLPGATMLLVLGFLLAFGRTLKEVSSPIQLPAGAGDSSPPN